MDWHSFTASSMIMSERIIKGVILAVWIGLLVWLAGLAASGKASQSIVQLFKPVSYFYVAENASQSQLLTDYLSRYDQPRPPLEAILDLIVRNPSWSDRDIASQFPEPSPNIKDDYSYTNKRSQWVKDQSFALFSRVDNIIKAIVIDRSIDPKDLSIEIPEVPAVYRDSNTKQQASVKLPRVMASWIEEQRIRDDVNKQRNSLIDTFFMLIVLGAFGSLIFLTKDYIQDDVKTNLAAYFFRPILGMFLAVAIFVIDMVAHSVVSTADILKVRHETLFLLALAAGLLSEQAYTVVTLRAQAALDKLREKAGSSDRQPK